MKFFLTKETQQLYDFAIQFYDLTPNSLMEYEQMIPSIFHKSLKQHRLHKDEVFEAWLAMIIEKYEQFQTQQSHFQEQATHYFETNVNELLSQSLYNGKIVFVEQLKQDLRIVLNMEQGLSTASLIELIFEQATINGEMVGYYLFEELIQDETHFGLRVLCGSPKHYEEVTIYFKDAHARLYYRPNAYYEADDWQNYWNNLLEEDTYFILENGVMLPITKDAIKIRENGYYAHSLYLASEFEQLKQRLYTKTFSQPYAYLSEPIAYEKLVENAFSDDESLRIRAFNTIFDKGEQAAPIAIEILTAAPFDAENIYLYALAKHFYVLQCLPNKLKTKWLQLP